MGYESPSLVPHATFGGGNASASVDDLALAPELARLFEYRAHEANGHIHRRVSLPGRQNGMHGAPPRQIRERRAPAAMHGAERMVETLRRRSCEEDAPQLGLDDPDI